MAGPCAPWTFDDACCDLPDGYDPDVLEAKLEIATSILWFGSGQRYGTCEVTIRPCLLRCGGGAGVWFPYKDSGGEWRNFSACGCHDGCSCTELCEIVLPGPVASVTQVLIDGDELMEDAYRLDLVNGEYRLLRTDGGCWPSCSDMNVGCDEPDSFCVTFEQGIELDALAIAAVSELACELTKACTAGCRTCKLPANVQQVVRRGVTITFDSAIAWLKALPAVNAFLSAVNPNSLMSSPDVFTPDIPPDRITVVPSGS